MLVATFHEHSPVPTQLFFLRVSVCTDGLPPMPIALPATSLAVKAFRALGLTPRGYISPRGPPRLLRPQFRARF